jgi:hypothetical protein
MKTFYLGMFSMISVFVAGELAAGEIDATMIVEPKPSSWEEFPESTVTADGILTLKADDSELSSKLHANVLYATKSHVPLRLHIIEPKQAEGEERLFPLVRVCSGIGVVRAGHRLRNTSIVPLRQKRVCGRGGPVSTLNCGALSCPSEGY